MITYFEVATGHVVDRFGLNAQGELVFETGEARPMVEIRIRQFGLDAAFRILSDWSNGYMQTREEDAGAPLTAAAEVHTGAMIALIPSDTDAQRLYVDGGEPVDQLHVTLMYLGEAAAIPPAAQDAIVERIRAMVEDAVKPDYDLPLQADGFAISVFNPGDAVDRDTCIVLGLSGSDLDAIHGMTVDCLAEVQGDLGGFDIPDQHLPWIPHLTLAYSNVWDHGDTAGNIGAGVSGDSTANSRISEPYAQSLQDFSADAIQTSSVDMDSAQPPSHRDARSRGGDGDASDPTGRGHTPFVRDPAVRGADTPGSENADSAFGGPRRGAGAGRVFGAQDAVREPEQSRVGRLRVLQTGSHSAISGAASRENTGLSTVRSGPTGTAASAGEAAFEAGIQGESSHAAAGAASAAALSELLARLISSDRFGPIVFDRLRIAFAGDLIDIPLTAPDTGAHTSTGVDAMGDKTTAAAAVADTADAPTFQTECGPGYHLMPDGSCMSDEDMALDSAEGAVPPPAPVPEGEHFHTIVTEGVSTGFRTFPQDGLTWREPPIAFHYEYSTAAHGGQMMTCQVGLITRIERAGADIHMWGPLDLDDERALEFARKLVQGYCRWTSVGLDESAEVEVVFPESSGDDGEGDLLEMLFAEPEQLIIKGRICEATAVSTPALADATMEPTPELIDALRAKGVVVASVTDFTAVAVHHTPTSDAEDWDVDANEARLDSPMPLATARAGYAWIDTARVEDDTVVKDACKFLHHEVTADGKPGAANMTACSAGIGNLNGARGGTTIPDADRQGVYDHLAAHMSDADQEPPELAHDQGGDAAVLTAASYTVTIDELPPAWWFDEPVDVSPDLAFTVTDQGRVFGFIAPRDIPHRSFRDRRVTVPIDRVDFSKWMKHDGAMTDRGPVRAGPITMSCGHADPLSTDWTGRREHYDNSCSIVAYAAGGIARDRVWMAGGLLPGVTADQIARMWAMRLSGDWQPHQEKPGWQEFIAALLVPAPGFAGSSDQLRPPPAKASMRMKGGMLVASAVPVRYQVTPVREPEPDLRPALDMIARQVGLDPATRMTVLRRRIGA